MIRRYSRFQTQEDTVFSEKLTTIILEIIEQKDDVSYHHLANILGYLKQMPTQYSPKTLKNLHSIAVNLALVISADLTLFFCFYFW